MKLGRPGFLLLLVGCALIPMGCDGDATVDVILATDLVGPVAPSAVRVELGSSPFLTRVVDASYSVTGADDLFAGVTVASFPAVPQDNYFLTVALEDAAGTEQLSRTLRLVVDGNKAVEVTMSQHCLATSCPGTAAPDLDTCVGGECVNQSCSSDFLSACPKQCVTDEACQTAADCPDARCVEGVCLTIGC